MVLGSLALALVVSPASVMGNDATGQAAALKESLSSVALPELPARVAKMVTEAKPRDQKSITIAAVRAAVERNPAAAPSIVSAVARAVPAVAGVAAATAAGLQPQQARAIAKAAAAAARFQAGQIVFDTCKEVPALYRSIAIGASEGAPGANQEILAAVSRAIPTLKPFVDQASKSWASPSGDFPLAAVIQQVENLAASQPAGTPRVALVAPPPPPRPPFVPGTQGNGDPQRKQIVVVQPGEGRIYSGP
jgi:hypothetical protein